MHCKKSPDGVIFCYNKSMSSHHEIAKRVEPSSKILRWFYFITGIVATLAYRIIFLLDPFWVKVVWYVGTIGFMIYFGHRVQVETKRAKLVQEYDLVKAIQESNIDEEKKPALSYLTETSLTSKARFNSAFIFVSSLVVFVASLAIDLYHWLV